VLKREKEGIRGSLTRDRRLWVFILIVVVIFVVVIVIVVIDIVRVWPTRLLLWRQRRRWRRR
jgi:t-SNARE complex subunit (syntaxin)